jgi:DnaJ homolog subfamily B member 12
VTMSATASGSKATPDGNSRSRDHKQGNQERKYTTEQKSAVIRVRKCASTAFYEILSLEKTASEADVKKAYRKLSLLTHPDKNGYEGADEAFKSEQELRRIPTPAETNQSSSGFSSLSDIIRP